jgi:hypothetical protein
MSYIRQSFEELVKTKALCAEKVLQMTRQKIIFAHSEHLLLPKPDGFDSAEFFQGGNCPPHAGFVHSDVSRQLRGAHRYAKLDERTQDSDIRLGTQDTVQRCAEGTLRHYRLLGSWHR